MENLNLDFIEPWEMEDVVGSLVNAQDSAVLQAVYEDIKGYNCSELVGMRKEDVEAITSNNELIVRGKNSAGEDTTRTVIVSDLLKRLLLDASKQTIYHRENGNSGISIGLVESPYVFRTALIGKQLQEDKAPKFMIIRRIAQIAQWFGMPHLNIQTLRNKPESRYLK